jgi:hypothetical protein
MRTIAAVCLSLFVPTGALWGQSQGRYGSTIVGPSLYSLSVKGTAQLIGARVTFPVHPALHLAPGLSLFRSSREGELLGQRFWEGEQILFPEIALEVLPPRYRWKPYVGVGVGASMRMGGAAPTGPTFITRCGLRAQVSDRIGVDLGAQYRAISPYGHTVDITLGVVQFPRKKRAA